MVKQNIENSKFTVKNDVLLVLETENMTEDEFCLQAGISRRTLNSIISEDSNLSFVTMNKIYNFIYSLGYRINAVKEELYKETYNSKVLFHGSKKGLDSLEYNGSRNTCDFGSAFYLGESFDNAMPFVCEADNSCIYSFKYNTDGLKILKLNCSLEWLLAICYYRKTITKYENSKIIKTIINKIEKSDIIIAPIADNRMFYIMQQFVEGEINSEVAIHSLSASSLGNQYVFRSKKAIKSLELLQKQFICSDEKANAYKQLIKRGDFIDSKIIISRREYEGKGKYIDELL